MGSSRSLWLLGGSYVAIWLADHPQGCPAVSNKQVLGRQEEGMVAASLLYSWQKCWCMGGGPETRGTCVSHYPPL